MAASIPEGFRIEEPEAPEGFAVEAPQPAKKTPTASPQAAPRGFRVEEPEPEPQAPAYKWGFDPKTYSTQLPDAEYEAAYKEWLGQHQIQEDDAYDYRGAFMFGHDPQDGQLPDMWRKPSNPYFTDDSVYFDQLPAQQRAKANTWQIKNAEAIAAAAEKGQTIEPEYELVPRGKMLYESLDTPDASSALSPREVEEAIEFYMSEDNTITAGDAALAAAKGLGHIVKQMLWDIPIDTVVDLDKTATEATEKYSKENPGNPTLATFKGLRDAVANAATSFASGTGTAAIDGARQLSKLLLSIDENVNALETGKARQSDNDTTSLGWTSSDYGDLVLLRQGAIDREEFTRRFTERHAYNKAFNQTREELPNPLNQQAYDIPTILGGQEPDQAVSEAAGKDVNRGARAAGEFYGYAKFLKHPSLAVERLAGMPIRQLSRGGAYAASKAGITVAPKVASAARSVGAKLDDYADTLAARGTIKKPTAEAFKSGGSIVKEMAIGGGALWAGSALGNLMGMPQVGGAIGTILTAYRRAGDIAGIARRGVERIETTAGLAEAAARIGVEFRQNGGRVVKESLKQVDHAIVARVSQMKQMAAAHRSKAQTPQSDAQFAKQMQTVQRDIQNLNQRRESLRLGRLYMVEGLSGKSIFQHIADKGKEGVLVNGVRKQINPSVLKLAERLDRKSVRWFLERGIPTAKSVTAMGTANVLLSIGADLPNEALAEAFGMGGLAFTGLLGKGSAQARQNKMGDAARGFVAMHEGVFRHLRNTLPEAKYTDEMVYEISKEKMVELLAKMPDEAAFLNAMDLVLAHRGRTDFKVEDRGNGPIENFFASAESRGAERPLISVDTRGTWAQGPQGVADTIFHESGHGVFEWVSKNRPEILSEFIRSVDNALPKKAREDAEWNYSKKQAWNDIQKSIDDQLVADGITDQAQRIEELKKAKEIYDAATREDINSPKNSEAKHYAELIEAHRKQNGDQYFANEIFADAVNRVLSTRDVTNLSKGRTGAQKGEQGVSGKRGSVTMGRQISSIIEQSPAIKLVEKAVAEFSNSKNDFLNDKARRKEREKGVQVPVKFGKGDEIGDIEQEAINRAHRDIEETGFNPQVDIYAPRDNRPGHSAAPDEKLIADNDWGKIFENENGGYRVIREQPKDIKARVRKRQRVLKNYRDKLKGKKLGDWGLSTTAGGVEVFGGSTPPPRFHLTLKSAGYKAEQVNAAWKWMQALKSQGQAVRFWNFGFGTSLNKGSWDKLITGTKGGLVRSQRTVRPTGIRITKKGEVLMEGFDLTVLDLRIEEFAEKGLLRPWSGDIEALKRDIEQVLYNWKSNRRGHRSRRVGNEVRPELPLEKKDIINALIIGKGPKAKFGKNPFRDTLSGKDAAGIIRTFRLDNIEQVRESGIEDAFYNYDRATENFVPDESTQRTPLAAPEEFQLEAEPAAKPTEDSGRVRGRDGLPGVSVFDALRDAPERAVRRAIQRSGQRAATQTLEAFGYSRIGKPFPGGDEAVGGGISATGDIGSIRGPEAGEGTIWEAIAGDSTRAGKRALRDMVKRIGQLGRSDRGRALVEIENFVAKDPANYTPAEAEIAKRVFSKVPRLDREDVASSINWSDMLYRVGLMQRANGEGQLHVIAHLAGILGHPLNLTDPTLMISGLLKEARERASKPSGNWTFLAAGAEGLVFDAGDSVIKVYPLRKSSKSSPAVGGMKIKDIEDSTRQHGHQSVGLDVEYGDQLDQLDQLTTMPYLPGVEAVELRGIVAQGGHLVIRQRKLRKPSVDRILTRTHEWMETHPNVVRLNSTSLPYSKSNKGVTSNQILVLGDDGFLYIVADFRLPNTGIADEGLRIVDPLIRRVTKETVQEIPELRRKARQLFSQVYGNIGAKMYREMMKEASTSKPHTALSIPVGKPQYNAVPDKFWLDPDGKIVPVKDWTSSGEHQMAALALLKKRHKMEFTEDESSMAVTELVKLGYRRGVYDRSLKTIFLNDHSPKWRVTPDQYEAIRGLALEEMVDVVNENLMTNETKKIFNFNFKSPGASWAPDFTSTEFQSWFKDSKIVDNEKKPLKVWHSTYNNFDAFEQQGGDPLFHFGTKDQAEYRARGIKMFGGFYNKGVNGEPRLIEAYLSIKNPIILKTDPGTWREAWVRAMIEAGYLNFSQVQEIKAQIEPIKDDVQRAKIIKDYMANLGYDGVIYPNLVEGEGLSFGAFYPNQIKSPESKFTLDDPRYNWAPEYIAEGKPLTGFESKLAKVIQQKIPNKVSKEQFEATLKGAGVKTGEIEWHLGDFLRSLKPGAKITKEQALAMMEATSLELEERVRGKGSYDKVVENRAKIDKIKQDFENYHGIRVVRQTPYADAEVSLYTLDAAGRIQEQITPQWLKDNSPEVYEEMLEATKEIQRLTLEQQEASQAMSMHDNPRLNTPGGENYRELIIKRKLIKDGDNYRKPEHFPEHNPIGHVRFNERTDTQGRRILFIEEIQSDWHQEGREKGYDVKIDTTGWTAEKHEGDPASGPIWAVRNQNGRWILGIPRGDVSTPEDAIRIARDSEYAVRVFRNGQSVPDAPFKGDLWQQLIFKRIMKWAVDNGFEGVAWTTGQMQIDRYNLRNFVDAIRITPDSTPGQSGSSYEVMGMKGGHWETLADGLTKEELEHTVGKEISTEALADIEKGGEFIREGEDLAIGGEGKITLYDKQLPAVANHVIKRYGAKVEKTRIPSEGIPAFQIWAARQGFDMSSQDSYNKALDAYVEASRRGGNTEVPFFPITEKMRELAKPNATQELWAPDDSRILTEITPSTKFSQLDNAEKREVVTAVLPKIAKNGSLAFLSALGIKNQVEESMGSYKGAQSPNLIITVDTDQKTAGLLSAFIGDALIQDEIYTVKSKPDGQLGAIVIEGEGLDRKAVSKALNDAGMDFTEEPGGRGWVVIDPRSFESGYTDRRLNRFARNATKIVEPLGATVGVFRMDSHAESKDTYANTIKQAAREFSSDKPLDILAAAKDNLYLPAEEGYRSFFQSIGRPITESLPSQAQGWNVTERGPRDPSEPYEAAIRDWRHYGNKLDLAAIDPAFHGTGKVGAERARKRDYPELYLDRTYIGLEGYKPEQGLPKNEYGGQVDIRLLYDQSKDPLNLWREAMKDIRESGEFGLQDTRAAATIMERKIKEAGFAGYFHGPVAALFYPIKPGEVLDYDSYKTDYPRQARKLRRNVTK